MLQEGDVIELKEGHKVYADIPKHFKYANKKGDFSLCHADILIGGELMYLAGKYIVIKAASDGGGDCHDGTPFRGGHHVYCVHADGIQKVDFYQSGGFTAMIKDIETIGKAELAWTIK